MRFLEEKNRALWKILVACQHSNLNRHEDQRHESWDDEVHSIRGVVVPPARAGDARWRFIRLVGGSPLGGTSHQRLELFNRDR